MADSDGDRLSDAVEAALGTNPRLTDTDQDGVLDGAEIDFGSDPRGPGQALGAVRSTRRRSASGSARATNRRARRI